MHQTKKKAFLVYQQGLQGAEFRSLGHMECIRLEKKTVPMPSEHLGWLKMSFHTLEKATCRPTPCLLSLMYTTSSPCAS